MNFLRNQKGASLLELGVIVAILTMIMWSIDLIPIQNLFQKSGNSVRRQIDAQSTIMELEALFENNGSITVAEANAVTFTNDDGVYHVYADDVSAGSPPFKIAFQKDSDPAYFTADGVSLLSDPERPGLEFVYRSQNGAITAVTGDIRLIDVSLTLTVGIGVVSYNTTLKVEPTTITLQTDLGPHGLVPPPHNLQPFFKFGPQPGARPPGGDY
jgi:hypothetical protein